MASFSRTYLAEVASIAGRVDCDGVERLATTLANVRDRGGRLFILGAGGGAGHASHAVNDFRKLCEIESYAPSDNVSELTAWINDEGWDGAYARWLAGSRLAAVDALLVFSVGGGSREHGISLSIVNAIDLARERGAVVLAVVGRDDGEAAIVADACVVVPAVAAQRLTPHTEEFQAVVWHLLVSHPALARRTATWEAIAATTVSTGSG